jgi:penicillin amidase
MKILHACCGAAFALAFSLLPATAQDLAIAGLHQPVRIAKDHFGIAHIYAKDEHDLFFAQGYNVASDRLFQLEIWRRQATGTLSEIVGRKELQRDIGNRLFRYRGDLTRELNWYHPHGAAIIGAFVEGINAYIAQTRRNPELLTPEFKMLGLAPGDWTPAVVISRFNGLLGNVDTEINTARSVQALGAEKVKDINYFQPGDPDLRIDPAVDVSLLNNDILKVFRAFRTQLHFTADELAPEYRNPKSVVRLEQMIDQGSPLDQSTRRQDIGSNNWVVSGSRTMSGYPLLMNDPHRVQEAPSLRYWVHLNAPGWNVIGGGEPALPGISIGHNEVGAWGLTIFGTDSEDLYVYDTNPANPLQYRYKGGWQTMTVVRESIPVKNDSAYAAELKYTRHGPVVYEDTVHHKAYAVRAAWLQTGAAPYLASLRMDQSKTWEAFVEACSYSRIPAENMIWADRSGNIGYQAVGIAPNRPNWSGLVPVPGDGRYEWNGFLPIKQLPHVKNPEKGFYNTSNEYQIPRGWPYRQAIHYTWADPYRAQSVAEVLGSGHKFSVADMVALQNNDVSIPARNLVPLLKDLPIADPAVAKAQSLLLQWDRVLDKDSIGGGIYEMFQRHLIDDVRDVVVPQDARGGTRENGGNIVGFVGMPSMTRIIAWMQAPDGRFGADPIEGRNALLVKSLTEAVADLTKRLGPDWQKWSLGSYHYAKILSPFSTALRPDLAAQYDVGHLPRGGDSYTVTATGGADNQAAGGSFKIVMDTENWDNSVGLNNPGQSGDINSPHYRDLYELWARGKYFPIFYSPDKVKSITESSLTLLPAH